MADYLEYDCEYMAIPEQDLPECGGVFICKEKTNTTFEWWIVSKYGAKPLGKFWKREMALVFAKAL